MTDIEFSILDELYFVTSKYELLNALEYSESEVVKVLETLILAGDVKCLKNDSDLDVNSLNLEEVIKDNSIAFLATKKGLFRHNTL